MLCILKKRTPELSFKKLRDLSYCFVIATHFYTQAAILAIFD